MDDRHRGVSHKTFAEFRKKGAVRLQEIYNSNGELLCHCVQYRGNGHYFTTKAEAYAYCLGRGFIREQQDPYEISSEEKLDIYSLLK